MDGRFYRQSWIEINLDNLYQNLQNIRSLFPAGIYVMAVVKADAYGHGIVPVARFLQSRMVNYLGTASLDEAILLRREGIKIPILVLGPVAEQDLPVAQFYGITLTITDEKMADEVRRYVVNTSDSHLKFHVKVDTGMHRLGLNLVSAEDVITKLFVSGVNLEGIYTHLASADTDPEFTIEQINRFAGLLRRLSAKGISFPLVHVANSAGLMYSRVLEGITNMVRPGLALYGVYPSEELKMRMRLLPVLSLKSRIIALRAIRAGESVGYNRGFIAPRDSRIAVVAVGYGDGYPRSVSNRGRVLIRERACPIVGRVCMDQLFVDVTDLEEVREGDEVVLIGHQGPEEIKVEEVASWCNTIGYEVLCQLGRRLPRRYLDRRRILRGHHSEELKSRFELGMRKREEVSYGRDYIGHPEGHLG